MAAIIESREIALSLLIILSITRVFPLVGPAPSIPIMASIIFKSGILI